MMGRASPRVAAAFSDSNVFSPTSPAGASVSESLRFPVSAVIRPRRCCAWASCSSGSAPKYMTFETMPVP